MYKNDPQIGLICMLLFCQRFNQPVKSTFSISLWTNGFANKKN